VNTRQTLSQRRARLSYWIPLIIASILLSVNDSTVAAQDDLPPQTNDDSAEVSEPIKSRITSLKEEIEKLKQFNEFVNQYNQLMKERRFAEAELVGKKAKDLQTNEPQAILMVEKAKMHRQLAFNESVRKRKEGSGEDISSAMEPVIDTEQIKIFNLKNSNANDIQLIIAQLFDGTTTTISVDERTNALIIRANESQLREIEAILLRLDSTETAARNSVSTDLPSIAANEPVISIAEYRIATCRAGSSGGNEARQRSSGRNQTSSRSASPRPANLHRPPGNPASRTRRIQPPPAAHAAINRDS
jgi:type II secretory pathway component GspD/PulD (secretin)